MNMLFSTLTHTDDSTVRREVVRGTREYDAGDDCVKLLTTKHLPVLLLIDVSGSMNGEPIEQVNRELSTFKDRVLEALAGSDCVCDIALISYSEHPQLVQNFVQASEFSPMQLIAGGKTDIANALIFASDLLRKYRHLLDDKGALSFRPILIHITDGYQNINEQDIPRAIKYIHQDLRIYEGTNKLKLWQFCTKDADTDALKQYSPFVVRFGNHSYNDVFNYLADSFCIVSASKLSLDTTTGLVEEGIQTSPPLPQQLQYVPGEVFNQ